MSDSSIDRLRDKLNSRTETPGGVTRTPLHERIAGDVPDDWEHEHDHGDDPQPMRRTQTNRAKTFFMVALGFFAVSLAIAALVIFRGANIVEPPEIAVTGPVAVDAGDVLTLELSVINRNTVPLRNADILVDYPPGTRDPAAIDTEQTRLRIPLGDIAAGSQITESASAALFGAEGDTQDIIITVEYRIDGSNAVFVKESQYSIQIGDAPLIVQTDAPDQLVSGDDITFEVSFISNTDTTTRGMLATIEYPFGFEFVSADPAPAIDDNTWNIGDLSAGDRYTIVVEGTLEGENSEERTFKVSGGIADPLDPDRIGATLLAAQHTVTITRPFVSADLTLASSKDSPVAVPNNTRVDGAIGWFNNLAGSVANVVVTAELQGNVLNEGTIQAPQGFYNSGNNTITWDASTLTSFRLVKAGGRGTLGFSFVPTDVTTTDIQNGTIDVVVTVTGVDSDSERPVSFQTRGSIVVTTEAEVTAQYSHVSGPNPPTAEEPSTLRIQLGALTASNDVRNARVTASLPSYVAWVGSDAGVTYNALRREISWDIGTLPAGTGFTTPTRSAEMNVIVTPSLSQLGTRPDILRDITLSGNDAFTNESIVERLEGFSFRDAVTN